MAKFKRKGKFPTWNVRGCEHISLRKNSNFKDLTNTTSKILRQTDCVLMFRYFCNVLYFIKMMSGCV